MSALSRLMSISLSCVKPLLCILFLGTGHVTWAEGPQPAPPPSFSLMKFNMALQNLFHLQISLTMTHLPLMTAIPTPSLCRRLIRSRRGFFKI